MSNMQARRRNVQHLLADPNAALHTVVAAYEHALTHAEMQAGRADDAEFQRRLDAGTVHRDSETVRMVRERLCAPESLDLPTVASGVYKDACDGEESRHRLCQEFNLDPDTPWADVLQAVVELRMRHRKLLDSSVNAQPSPSDPAPEPFRRIRKGRLVYGREPISGDHHTGELVEYTGDGKAKVRVGTAETDVMELDADSLILDKERDAGRTDDR